MEQEIIRLLAERQEEGLRLLDRAYGNRLRYIVSGILPAREDADECLSDVHMQIWNKFAQYSPEKGSLAAWAGAIARNTALNYRRRQEMQTEEWDENAGASRSPEEELLRRELRERLAQVIRSLGADEQKLFYRKYYYMQSTAQIAAEMGLTERSVEGRLYRLRKRLQKQLGGEQE